MAEHYGARIAGGLLDGWVVDEIDAHEAAPAGVVQRSRPLVMSDIDTAASIAGACLELALELRR